MADDAKVTFRFVEESTSSGGGGGTAPRAPAAKTNDPAASGNTSKLDNIQTTLTKAADAFNSAKDVYTGARGAINGIRGGNAASAFTSAQRALNGGGNAKTLLNGLGGLLGGGAGTGATATATAAAAGTGTAAGATTATAAAGGGAAVTGGALAAVGGPVTLAIAAVLAGFVAVGYASKKASDGLREIGEQVGQFSGAVQAARGQNRALNTLQDIRRAQRFGDRIARQESIDGRFDRAFTEFSDNVKSVMFPLATIWQEGKGLVADVLEGVNELVDNARGEDSGDTPMDAIQKARDFFNKEPLPETGWLGPRGLQTTQELELTEGTFEGIPMGNR
ncbi:MAG: hypothetical protein QM811_07040 [Pirellulales bacterium]